VAELEARKDGQIMTVELPPLDSNVRDVGIMFRRSR